MSHVEIRQNINELKAELLNQYGAVIVFLADWDPYVQQLKVEVVRDKSMPIKTVKEKIKSIQSIKFSNLESVERIKFHKIKDDFEEGETQEIYQAMLQDQHNPRYEQFQKDYKYSIGDLIELFNQLDSLSSRLSNLTAKEAEEEFEDIFYQYICLNTVNYGLTNKALKKRIDKTRVVLGERTKIRNQKNEMLTQIVLRQHQQGKRWKSADQVAKDCIEVIEEEFEKFDTKWLNDKLTEIEVNISFQESRLKEVDKNDPKYKNSEQLMTIMREEILNIKNALKRGYPYEEYNDFLSYGTEYVEKSISNTLRKNKPLLEKILEQSEI
ncbi:hypothetical protein [Acinetobacter lwoffii]|uniref:Uncharacterized protein n=1 Tax=Acinetobacter lwoffii TaxID=28090 RepID=A0A6N1N4A1_ACILW|nr:hypothetical protein [Acinetobacter lwoffii]MCU4614990.1 hypothetical protein [Acinetobacter lwoffii]NKS44594.1 hypothetical protein [Acinetobacter lwoffii]QKU22706.1 hypothetical protein FOB19_15695 [Acinetobacter lwoffii]